MLDQSSSELLAFRLSQPVEAPAAASESQWKGGGKAVAGWYCTSRPGTNACGYCQVSYQGSTMTCSQWSCGAFGTKWCDAT